MSKRIPIVEPTAPRIPLSDPTVRRLDAQAVAEALGAEACVEGVEGQPGPITLYALRSELLRRRQSHGGRPGLEGTSFRAKIPVGDQEWQRLEALAASLSAEGFSPSPGQVASVLLSIALRSVSPDAPQEPARESAPAAALAQELAARLAADKRR